MKSFISSALENLRNDKGITALEYAILAVAIVGAVVAVTSTFQTDLGTEFAAIFSAND